MREMTGNFSWSRRTFLRGVGTTLALPLLTSPCGMANLCLSLLERMEAPSGRFGDSTGLLAHLT